MSDLNLLRVFCFDVTVVGHRRFQPVGTEKVEYLPDSYINGRIPHKVSGHIPV